MVRVLKERVDAAVRRHPPTALSLSEVLVRAAAEVPRLEILARRGRATALHYNGYDEQAIVEFRRCVELSERAGDELEAAKVRRSLVEVLQNAGRADEALECAALARPTLERHGERRVLAQLEVNVGNLYLHRDEYPAARRHYRSARALFEELGDTLGIAIVDYDQAVVEMNANRLDDADAALRNARESFARAGMEVHVADCDYSLAYLESRRGHFEAAIAGLEHAREAYRSTGKPSGVPLCDLDLAEIHLKLDALFDAVEHARHAALKFEELHLSYELARAEILMGLGQARMGRTREAQATFDRAGGRLEGLGNEVYAAALEVQRAFLVPATAVDVERLSAARDRLNQRSMAVPVAMATIAIARTRLARSECEAARDELLGLLSTRGDNDPLEAVLEAEALRTLAACRSRLGDTAGAVEDLRAATRAIDRAYQTVGGADLRLTFLRDRHNAFVDLSWLLAELDTPEAAREAFLVLERSRSRSLEEEIGGEPIDEEYRKAREQLDWLLSRKLDAEFGHSTGQHDLRELCSPAEEVRVAQERVASLARRARSRQPSEVAPFDVADLRPACGASDVLLAYLTTGSSCRMWLVEGEEVRSLPLSITPRRIANLRDRLWLHLDRCRWEGTDRDRLQRALDPILDELGESLVPPQALEASSGRGVVVLPFGVLHDLPFHALRVAQAFLIERCDVSYAFSARMLSRRRGSPSPASGRVLAAGSGRTSLSLVEEELAELARLFGERFEECAPEELVARLLADPPRQGLLHVAGHGLHQPDNAVFSALSLGDRVLLAHDIGRARLDLALAVLSGCETGRKSRAGGDELFGLTRAFFAAGTRSVVGSLWSVEDRDASRFMARFYGRLARGECVRSAICGAQRDLLQDRGHPYSWGAFALTGDPDLLFPASPTHHGPQH